MPSDENRVKEERLEWVGLQENAIVAIAQDHRLYVASWVCHDDPCPVNLYA